ncbi:hypothetical protein T08_10135 [Trichinella sp. T8]|nr:hypothetical protein T08_10135 [Trichinella sp. T8]
MVRNNGAPDGATLARTANRRGTPVCGSFDVLSAQRRWPLNGSVAAAAP